MDRDDSRDPDAPPSAEEVVEAAALRDALEGRAPNAGADFARALALSHAPRPIGDAEHRDVAARAIATGDARRSAARRRRRAVVTLASGIALAAAIAIQVGRASLDESASPAAAASIEPLLPVRSTQPLFHEPFAKTGGESARIDRIALARAGDLRDNRFAAWGVR